MAAFVALGGIVQAGEGPAFDVRSSGRDNRQALQAMLDRRGVVRLDRPGRYRLSGTVYIGSDTRLECAPGVVLVKTAEEEGPFSHVILNRGALSKTWDRNISIDGLEIAVNGVDCLKWQVFGLRGQVAFHYARDVKVTRFRCPDLGRAQYCLQFCNFEDVLVDDVRIEGGKDGVHFGTGRRFAVRNGVFDTGDDPIALNAHDYSTGNPELGWIEDGIIENCHDLFTGTRHVGFFCRILAGAWRDWFEGMDVQQSDTVVSDGKVYRVQMPVTDGRHFVSKTRPTHESGQAVLDGGIVWGLVQTNALYACGVRNVSFRDIFLHQPRTAFSVHYDNGKYSRSYYPGARIAWQENLSFAGIRRLQGEPVQMLSVSAPVRNVHIASDSQAAFAGAVVTNGLAARLMAAEGVVPKLDEAHAALKEEFFSDTGHLLDYRGEIPTPEDCARGFPNANGYNTPLANGAMFTGTYLMACVDRANRLSGTPQGEDAAREVRSLAKALMRLASISDVPGMVVRGIGTDGVCHYASGTCDQTLPWILGLRAYARSCFCPEEERRAIVDKILEVVREIEKLGWRIPADGLFKGQAVGGLLEEGAPGKWVNLAFRASVGYLFVLKVAAELSGDTAWENKYRTAREERYPEMDVSRREIVSRGWAIDAEKYPCDTKGMWIYVHIQALLVELLKMEKDEAVRLDYRKGLLYNAERARMQLGKAVGYDNCRERPFRFANWRTGYAWRPQTDIDDAVKVANTGKKEILGERKKYLREWMTAPLSAAAVCALAGCYPSEVEAAIKAYDYRQIDMCEFFFAEVAGEALGRAE